MSSTPPTVQDRYYRPELDWLRFIAFSLVFLMHAVPSRPDKFAIFGIPYSVAQYTFCPIIAAGGYGVDLFFALSAFLLTELLLREKETTGGVHIKAFYLRRILRIWPLYLAFMFAIMPYELLTKDIPVSYYVTMLAFVGNWYAVLFTGYATLCGNLWTICVEEQFYIVWPNLVGRLKAQSFAKVLLAILVFTCLYRILYVYGPLDREYVVWYNTFTRLDAFACGGLLACFLHKRTISLSMLARVAIFFAGIALIWVLGNMPIAGFYGRWPAWTYPTAAISSVLMIIAFVTAPGRQQLNRPLRTLSYLGKISYGLYVFHGPSLRLFERLFRFEWPSPEWNWVARAVFAALVTFIASVISYTFLEKPFLQMKRRFTFVESRPV